jgi:hypothetical protein
MPPQQYVHSNHRSIRAPPSELERLPSQASRSYHTSNKYTPQILSITNADPHPVRIALVGGSLWPLHVSTPEGGPIRNLTAIPYNVEIPAGTNQSLTYNFATELHPQDLRLVLAAVVARGEVGYQVAAFNGTVSVVEAPLSFFDPQM